MRFLVVRIGAEGGDSVRGFRDCQDYGIRGNAVLDCGAARSGKGEVDGTFVVTLALGTKPSGVVSSWLALNLVAFKERTSQA